MKKIIIVSKTHLDLGFTDYAENIRNKYINEFIPGAINLAAQVNSEKEKSFVWTTGSWILKEALADSDEKRKKQLIKALKNGDIAPHALPFTTHTELFDEDTFEYGLSIVNELDKIRGKKTVAAKMTDVPGHTKGIIKLLAKHGIKLLHIGVNGASAIPDVPECFLWKNGDAEIVVIYSGAYGGAYKSEFIEEILYFDHTLDNHGAPSPEKVREKIENIRNQYPDYTVSAGTLDEYAEAIWAKRSKLPVLDCEIGDTWIHGSAADPYKSASLRTLMMLKKDWLKDGTLTKNSNEYLAFTDALLCIGEHTCGMDNKMYFADYENYLKKDFQKARKKDKVKLKHPLRDYPQNLLTVINRKKGNYKKGSYSVIEKSWAEQRGYIAKAICALSDEHKKQAEKALQALRPEKMQTLPQNQLTEFIIEKGKWRFELNSCGGIGSLSYNGDTIIRKNNAPIIEYRAYSKSDYDYWLSHYSRELEETAKWVHGDFSRPLLKYAEGKYLKGSFFYHIANTAVAEDENSVQIYVNLKCDSELCENQGAPRDFQLIYSLCEKGLHIDVSWFGKDANRLTEAVFLHMYPENGKFTLQKLGCTVKPETVVSKGSRNLHAVEKSRLETIGGTYDFINRHSPLISIGRGKILEFDNKFENHTESGISYVLYDNVWGTNFPLWYEDNAHFEFGIETQ